MTNASEWNVNRIAPAAVSLWCVVVNRPGFVSRAAVVSIIRILLFPFYLYCGYVFIFLLCSLGSLQSKRVFSPNSIVCVLHLNKKIFTCYLLHYLVVFYHLSNRFVICTNQIDLDWLACYLCTFYTDSYKCIIILLNLSRLFYLVNIFFSLLHTLRYISNTTTSYSNKLILANWIKMLFSMKQWKNETIFAARRLF